ncbi:hypothetical protein HanXRQr2_Chr12g0537661 [Helianthus annuus]|uniref:Uncharacterized protein n=1 Tax=Helianthus annuus TaxID=4232 RepID=A0A9K3MVQ7_HELAN|nr:hypothetical protein HanXRQr2_Chr12g0537661 [Helianthus annuus]
MCMVRVLIIYIFCLSYFYVLIIYIFYHYSLGTLKIGKRSPKQGEKTGRMTYVVIQAGPKGLTNTVATWKK